MPTSIIALRARSRDRTMAAIGRCLGVPGDGAFAKAAYAELLARKVERTFQTLRIHRPGSWRPSIQLMGRERIEQARASGKGSILLVSNFASSCLIPKMAMHGAGLSVTHLSRFDHGFSKTRFARLVLNPVRTSAENRFLLERAVITPDGPVSALRRLRRCLAHNGIVTIKASDESLRPVCVPFLGMGLNLAPGAFDLAYSTGAALLPVFSVREPDGRYLIYVGSPIERSHHHDKRAVLLEMATAYAQQLEPFATKHPGQWRGWQKLVDFEPAEHPRVDAAGDSSPTLQVSDRRPPDHLAAAATVPSE